MRKATKLRNWCRENNVGLTTAYQEIKLGRLCVVYLGRTPYVLEEESQRYWASLQREAA